MLLCSFTLLPKPFLLLPSLNPNRRRPRLCASPSPTPPSAADPPKPAAPADGPAIPSPTARRKRRGRRGDAADVEDFVRRRLQETLAAIREKDPAAFDCKGPILKEPHEVDGEEGGERGVDDEEELEDELVEEEDQNWPLDAEVGWGIRASDYFAKRRIESVVLADGRVIDWEKEMEEGLVKEINCLEWEQFAFHPSPLVLLVFERYERPVDNWNQLMELEKAAKVYWRAKDRLPPRTVKIDVNIETDLAYALKVKECPQLLFLKGNKILYRDKDARTAEELVQMIGHFYYNAKRPSWVDPAAIAKLF